MSLKRKASFSALSPINTVPVVAGPSRMVEDSPRHLHSRTRKRFRDDRPDEKVVYENTLRWLFNAQKHQHGPAPPIVQDEDEDADMDSEPLPPSEITDPRQQTLHKFFQTYHASSSLPHSNDTTDRQTHHTSQSKSILLHNCNHIIASPGISSESSSSSSALQFASAHADMGMESSSDDSGQDPKRWAGALAWA
ncbi:hypothetical protein Asppvi_001246 [Aspergillus pseudoviridinutans]|uniref:Uncharacterized protein n=1 Tax=Aspergillus pseudoviridinutans TaxID=1517512 RepID=A0A9P3ERJ7_9EURO|nr:uncharacterized protein Asppvi_001246 [Aspergillus pseudoviridinutans]GIJ82735.1 hypothetical protein Asppvi_001246 [Aspergillus pseudoviridinutans]